MIASSKSIDVDTTSSECHEVDDKFDNNYMKTKLLWKTIHLEKDRGRVDRGNLRVVAKKKKSDSKDMREKYLSRQPREF
jgi:hypothetical protein